MDYILVINKAWYGWYKITNLEWNDLLENKNSKEFNDLKVKNENMVGIHTSLSIDYIGSLPLG